MNGFTFQALYIYKYYCSRKYSNKPTRLEYLETAKRPTFIFRSRNDDSDFYRYCVIYFLMVQRNKLMNGSPRQISLRLRL